MQTSQKPRKVETSSEFWGIEWGIAVHLLIQHKSVQCLSLFQCIHFEK